MDTRKLLGLRIKELRKAQGMTQERLAEIVDIEPKHLSRIEVGKSFPSLDTLEKIAAALNDELKDFFEFQHLHSPREVRKSINSILEEVDPDKLSEILKILRAVIK